MSDSPTPVVSLTSEELLRLEDLCDAFEAQLKSSTTVSLRDYLAETTGGLRDVLTRELLALELDHRVSRGEAPSPVDYRGQLDLGSNEIRGMIAEAKSRFRPPSRIAHFELQSILGKGTFGTVWKAFDTQLRRTVSLKIAHAGAFGDPETFLREGRTAARLQHPNIVRVLDLGQAEGQIYIVREFIDGQTLSQKLASGSIEPRRCAEICLHLSSALAHSHGLGCIHRDIKPQNVLLDGSGRPFLMYFGLAKSDAHLASATRTGDVIGTPAYMAPEQARGESRFSDARTDLYGLGVVLFQMLTRELPFRGSVEMTVAQILTEDPPNPCRLRREIPTDLASICLKCMEKDPSRRYASAEELGSDLRRFLAGKPTVARPLHPWQKAYRWARRRPVVTLLLAATTAMTVTIIVGGTLWSLSIHDAWEKERSLRARAETASAQATANERIARDEAEVSRRVTGFLENIFAVSDPVGMSLRGEKLAANDTMARELVLRAVQKIETELSDQPRVQARLMDVLGNILRSLGQFQEAESLLNKAATVRGELAKSLADVDWREEIATNLFHRAALDHAKGAYAEAEVGYQNARDRRVDVLGETSLPVAETDFHLGWLALESKQKKSARDRFGRCLEIRKKLLPPNHTLVLLGQVGLVMCDANHAELPTISALGVEILGFELAGQVLAEAVKIQSARAQRDFASAAASYRRVIDAIRPRLTPEHPVMALTLGDYAGILWEAGDYQEALPIVQEAIRIGRRFAPYHPHMATALRHLANELMFAQRFDLAETYFRDALKIPNQPTHARAESTHGLIWCCWKKGNHSEALRFAEQTHELAPEHSAMKVWSLHCWARILELAGKEAESKTRDQEALASAKNLDLSNVSPLFLDRMAVIFGRAKDHANQEKMLRLALEQEQARRPLNHPRVGDRLNALGAFLFNQGQIQSARPLLQQALEIREKRLPVDDPRTVFTRDLVARAQE